MATNPAGAPLEKPVQELDNVVIRFAGDSGDGMQLTGNQFTTESVLAGNDIGTLPDFPAEIRAPTGTLYGVSAFQVNFSNDTVYTPGDDLDALVAMNPAALKTNLGDLKPNGIVIVNTAEFNPANLRKAQYETSPLDDSTLDGYQSYRVDVTKMTTEALKSLNLPNRTVMRCRNFFALGVVSWLFNRPIEPTLEWIQNRFKRTPEIAEANTLALKGGYNLAENTELFASSYEIKPAQIAPGTYRSITGNTATAIGFVAAANKAGLPILSGQLPDYPGQRRAARPGRAQELQRLHLPGRGRNRRGGLRPGGRLWRRDSHYHHGRSGHEPQGRNRGLGRFGRAAADHHRYSARRSEHGHADQAGAGRPVPGRVWPSRRIAGSGDCRFDSSRLL